MADSNIVKGTAWLSGDFTTTYDLLPQEFWQFKSAKADLEELGNHAMEGLDPNFSDEAKAGKYSIVIGGRNFGGGGKSIEMPVYALQAVGVKAIVAESMSRYFFRNAINNGLPVFVSKGISSKVKNGDEVEINISKGEILNKASGDLLETEPMDDVVMEILNSGGYIPYVEKKMGLINE